jgi:hypothetical protein
VDEETYAPAEPAADRVECARCGVTADGDVPPPEWLCAVENSRRQYFCDDCARTHIRAIESRLDPEWW